MDSLAHLRVRLLAVARRRVPSEAAEDIVQSTLQIILEKGVVPGRGGEVEGRPPLAWCFQALRHSIGNYYQRERTRMGASNRLRTMLEDPVGRSDALTPLEALESRARHEAVRAAVASLTSDGTECHEYFQQLMGGATPADLAARAAIAEAVLYRRLYRCRQKLRQALQARGVSA